MRQASCGWVAALALAGACGGARGAKSPAGAAGQDGGAAGGAGGHADAGGAAGTGGGSGAAGALGNPDDAAAPPDSSPADGGAEAEPDAGARPDGGTPLGTLPAATAPLAAGVWTNQTACRPPQSLAPPFLTVRMTHDKAGQLFVLGANGADGDVSHLWQWDEAAHHFWDRTACTPEAAWPNVQSNVAFGYDPMSDAFLVVGAPVSMNGNYMTWTRAVGGGTWGRKSTPEVYSLADDGRPLLTRDPLRKSMVLTGGLYMELPDGAATWKALTDAQKLQAIPTATRPVTVSALQAYDPSRGVIMSVAAGDAGFTTWEYALATSTWADRSGTNATADVDDLWLWWDSGVKRIEMLSHHYDGQTTDTPAMRHWDATNGAWVEDAPAAGSATPAGQRAPLAASYDESRGRVVVWFASGAGDDEELWAWNVAARTWTRLSLARWPALWPGVVGGGPDSVALYDSGRGRLVWLSSPDGGDVEALDWDGLSPAFNDPRPSAAGAWPSQLEHLAAAYDRDDGRVFAFGLRNLQQPQLWEWHGDTGTWIDRTNANDPDRAAPFAGGASSMTYDARRGRVVLWSHPFNSAGRALWEWDPETGIWTQPDVPANVLARLGDGPGLAVYDESRGRVVLASPGPAIAEWDGAAWTLPAMTAPVSHAGDLLATYDPRRARVVFLQGLTKIVSWDGQRLADETPQALASAAASLTAASAFAYDWTRGNFVLIGTRADSFMANAAPGFGVWTGSATPPP